MVFAYGAASAADPNLQTDICVLVWMPEQKQAGMTAPQVANFRRYARALKAVAVLGRSTP